MLKRGDVILLGAGLGETPDPAARPYLIVFVNECRALAVPRTRERVRIGDREFETPGTPVNISPHALVQVVGRGRVPREPPRAH